MQEEKLILIEFEEGEEIISGLKKAFSENKIQKARISSVQGRIHDFDLNVFKGGLFRKTHFEEIFKITSIHGTFLEKGNMGYKGELTVSLAGENSRSAGGTLLTAKASGKVIIKADIEEFK